MTNSKFCKGGSYHRNMSCTENVSITERFVNFLKTTEHRLSESCQLLAKIQAFQEARLCTPTDIGISTFRCAVCRIPEN